MNILEKAKNCLRGYTDEEMDSAIDKVHNGTHPPGGRIVLEKKEFLAYKNYVGASIKRPSIVIDMNGVLYRVVSNKETA